MDFQTKTELTCVLINCFNIFQLLDQDSERWNKEKVTTNGLNIECQRRFLKMHVQYCVREQSSYKIYFLWAKICLSHFVQVRYKEREYKLSNISTRWDIPCNVFNVQSMLSTYLSEIKWKTQGNRRKKSEKFQNLFLMSNLSGSSI